MLPFSREVQRLERLKSSLALYRLAFGQREPFVTILQRRELFERFGELGVWDNRTPSDGYRRSPSFLLKTITHEDRRRRFYEIVEWMISETRKAARR